MLYQFYDTLNFVEEEAWIDKNAMDLGSNSLDESSPKNSRNIKNSANYKANCLTPRSCPVCARVYSNVSNLRQHMRLIHNPTAVICPICQKVILKNYWHS